MAETPETTARARMLHYGRITGTDTDDDGIDGTWLVEPDAEGTLPSVVPAWTTRPR